MKEAIKADPIHVLLGLGSNLDPELNLLKAVRLLSEMTHILKTASIWQSAAVGHTGPDYLNTAVLITTQLTQKELQSQILSQIEEQLGRVRGLEKYIDRTIDLDILVYGDQVRDPEIWEQAHASLPASEILPDLVNPLTGKTLIQTAIDLKQRIEIQLRSDLQIS